MVTQWIINSLPYDITKRIRQHFASSDDINDGKDSFYIQIGGKKVEIRVSNHCTHLWTWHERKNGKFDDITRISIVFEDKDTYEDTNLLLSKPRNTPFRIMEFVYRITEPNEFTPEDVKLVIQAIKQTIKRSQMYKDPTGKMLYCEERISINPKPKKLNKLDRLSLRKFKESGDYVNLVKMNEVWPYKIRRNGVYGTYHWLKGLDGQSKMDLHKQIQYRQYTVFECLREYGLHFTFLEMDVYGN